MTSREDLERLILNHQRRLQKLREQKALHGISVDPKVSLEIEDIEAKIVELNEELSELENAAKLTQKPSIILRDSDEKYYWQNIRMLLTEGFSDSELRRFAYDAIEFRPVYNELAQNTGKAEIIDRLLEYTAQKLLTKNLLEWAKEHNPARFAVHEPYFSNITIPPITESLTISEEIIVREKLVNPYVVGNPIQPDNIKVFLGRFDIAESITNEIRKAGQRPSILLYGRRRMGKTSALLNMSHLVAEPDLLPVYISVQSSKFHTNINFCYYLVDKINKRLQQNFIDTSTFQQRGFLTKDTFMQNPVLTLAEFFDVCYELLDFHNKHCLLAIDEYEEIDHHINTNLGNYHDVNITRELLLELRDTLQHKPRFIFLFAGTHYLRDLSTVNWSEIFINVKTLHVSFLEKRDGYRLLTEPVPALDYQSEKLIEDILHMTGCQPFLLQAIASELVNILNSNDSRLVTKAFLDQAIDEVMDKNGTYFDYIWDTECSTKRHKELLKLATTKIEAPEEQFTNYPDELRDLIRREVLKKENGYVKLTMPIVKFWLKKNQHLL